MRLSAGRVESSSCRRSAQHYSLRNVHLGGGRHPRISKLCALKSEQGPATLEPPAEKSVLSSIEPEDYDDMLADVCPATDLEFERLPSQFATLSMDGTQTSNGKGFLEAGICRLYYFNRAELHTFKDLVGSMSNSRSALTALAAANIWLSLAQASGYGHHAYEGASSATLVANGLTVGDVAYWADSLMVAFLISYAIKPFESVMCSRNNQMAYCFQGLNRLALIFQQLSIGSVAVSTATALEAAAKFPALSVGTSFVFFGVAIVRSGAMWWTLSRHATNNEEVSRTLSAMRAPAQSTGPNAMGLLDRWATFLAFGYLLQYEQKSPQAPLPLNPSPASTRINTSSGPGPAAVDDVDKTAGGPVESTAKEPSPPVQGYEFSLTEERLLRGLTEAASTAGLALGLQAFVTLMLGFADVGVDDLPSALGNGVNGANKAVMAAILFNACSAYDRALHTATGNDVDHLMDGLGSKGLTGLFNSLAVLSWAITIATVLGLALPWIQDSLLTKAAGDSISTWTAETLIKVLQYGRNILRSI